MISKIKNNISFKLIYCSAIIFSICSSQSEAQQVRFRFGNLVQGSNPTTSNRAGSRSSISGGLAPAQWRFAESPSQIADSRAAEASGSVIAVTAIPQGNFRATLILHQDTITVDDIADQSHNRIYLRSSRTLGRWGQLQRGDVLTVEELDFPNSYHGRTTYQSENDLNLPLEFQGNAQSISFTSQALYRNNIYKLDNAVNPGLETRSSTSRPNGHTLFDVFRIGTQLNGRDQSKPLYFAVIQGLPVIGSVYAINNNRNEIMLRVSYVTSNHNVIEVKVYFSSGQQAADYKDRFLTALRNSSRSIDIVRNGLNLVGQERLDLSFHNMSVPGHSVTSDTILDVNYNTREGVSHNLLHFPAGVAPQLSSTLNVQQGLSLNARNLEQYSTLYVHIYEYNRLSFNDEFLNKIINTDQILAHVKIKYLFLNNVINQMQTLMGQVPAHDRTLAEEAMSEAIIEHIPEFQQIVRDYFRHDPAPIQLLYDSMNLDEVFNGISLTAPREGNYFPINSLVQTLREMATNSVTKSLSSDSASVRYTARLNIPN